MVSGNAPGHSKAQLLQIPCTIFFFMTPIFVAVRIWVRLKVGSWKGLGFDDWAILASTVFAMITMSVTMVACEYGYGQHLVNLSVENKMVVLKMSYLQQIFYKLTINLTKASIILLYLRIFVQRWFRATCNMLLGIVLSYMVASIAASIWQCSPIALAWDWSTLGTCINLTDAWLANTVYSIVTDFIILGLPMYPIYESHLPTGQKIALVMVFSLGLVTTVASIMRLPNFHAPAIMEDVTYNVEISFFTTLDQNLAIICACLPVCRLPLACLFPRHFSASNSSPKKRFIGTIDATIKATDNRQSCSQSHHEAQSSGAPTSYTHPLEKGILKATAGWDNDEETDSYDMEMEQKTHTRSETQVTGPPKNISATMDPGPGIRFVQQYSVTYESQLGR